MTIVTVDLVAFYLGHQRVNIVRPMTVNFVLFLTLKKKLFCIILALLADYV